MLQLSPLPNPPRAPGPRSPQAQVPGHRGDETCDAGRAAGRRVVGAADAVVLDGLAAEKRGETMVGKMPGEKCQEPGKIHVCFSVMGCLTPKKES